MNRIVTLGIRFAGLVAIAAVVSACGDSDVHVTGGVDPSAGTFVGSTDEGGNFEIIVGSIEAIAFDCDEDHVQHTFTPPEPVEGGHFDVRFTDEGRRFRVEGHFLNDDEVEGTIDDEDDQCDTDFFATRNGVSNPTRTATPGPGGVTPTPGGPTSNGGPTLTAGTPTGATPTGATPTGPTATGATPTPTPGGSCTINGTIDAGEECDGAASPNGCTAPAHCNLDCTCGCPKQLTTEGQGETADLDSGWTGIAMDSKVVGKGTLTVAMDCGDNQPGSCGTCTVTGPIASTTVVNNLRRPSDSSQICDTPGADCAFLFGAPLPLSSGGVPVCVTNKVNGQITGTANVEDGTGAASVSLTSSVFTGIQIDRPCPRCSGPAFNTTGTCSDGPRAGMACTVHGTSAAFGNTSFDCPPNAGANVGNLQIALNPTTGTSTLATSASNMCEGFGFDSFQCFCPGQLQTNACSNGTCVAASGQAAGEGTCQNAPNDNLCTPTETFRSCSSNAECTKPGDTCGIKRRECSGLATAGNVTAPISRTGVPSSTAPTLVSTFCIAAVSAPAVNEAGGLPGPGAIRLPSKTCLDARCTFP